MLNNLESYSNRIARLRDNLGLSIPIKSKEMINALESKLGIKCIAKSTNELIMDTKLVRLDNRTEIWYSENLSECKLVYLLAFELSRLLSLDCNELVISEFAAMLVMPKDEFIYACKKHICDGKVDITKVSEDLNVTVQAVNVRGHVLSLW